MLCRNPYCGKGIPFGCGQCMPCRHNRRRLWSHRIVLESMKHNESSFLTLTYEEMPENEELKPKDLQDWLKRFRAKIAPNKIRYFAVGEYGDETQRPHYHLALFGLGSTNKEIIESTWTKGFSYVGDLTFESAQYVAGYVTKKLTNKTDPRLEGRHPEFARMSLKPGIGALAVPDIVDVLTSENGSNLMVASEDVPLALQHGKRKLPLGRYLRSKIREHYGFKETTAPREILLRLHQEVRSLYDEVKKTPQGQKKSFKQILIDQDAQKVANMDARLKIFTKGKIL